MSSLSASPFLIRFRNAWISRNMIMVLVILTAVSAVFTYLNVIGGETPLGIKPSRLWWLLGINLGLLFLLISVIGARIFFLWVAFKQDTISSKLQKRILILFSVVAVMPTIIVSVFSALFFNIGIQTWFNDRVQTAVQESLAVAEAYLSEHKENIRADALAMAADLNQVTGIALSNPTEFNRIVVAQSALRLLTESIVFQRNRIIAQGRLSFALAFERVPQDAIERANQGEVVITATEDDKVRALVKLEGLENAYLMVGRLIDSKVINHMQSAQGAVNEYNNLKLQLDRLQFIFSILFVALALLLLLTSVGYGMVFAARLTNPIANLALAAERVRSGDFSARVKDPGDGDEIGMLSQAFNRMTEQLSAQRGDLIDANRRLDERRRFSEAVLFGVSAGVIALDPEKKITLYNRSATSILSAVEQQVAPDYSINDILPGINELLVQVERTGDEAQSTVTLNKNNNTITLHVRVTVEKLGEKIEGFIVTFDDITLLVSAQRTAAWADVARRVAHEIKNPLTPIQLSAERLKKKYLKFITEDQDSFVKYTDTISRHVADISKMVEEFVSFARMPTPVFSNEDIIPILKKAVFSAQVANPTVQYIFDVPTEPAIICCDERQITQVMTNLLKNAAEAVESRMAQRPGEIEKGRIAVNLSKTADMVNVTIQDNGIGFPPGEIQKMLEPYVTTRAKGMGLGLSIVKKIIDDHKGRINIDNNSDGGAKVMLSFLQHCDINASV